MQEQEQSLKECRNKMPVGYFQPLTFGELNVGDQFIILPQPGNNEQNMGLRISYNLYTKVEMTNDPLVSYTFLIGKAVDNNDVEHKFTNIAYVIKINTGQEKTEEEISILMDQIADLKDEMDGGWKISEFS